MKYMVVSLAFLLALACSRPTSEQNDQAEKVMPQLKDGTWRFVVQSPGGDLPIKLTVATENGQKTAYAHNDDEKLAFDTVLISDQGEITLLVDHYESGFRGTLGADGNRITGTWSKTANGGDISQLPFEAYYDVNERFIFEDPQEPADLGGRWAVTFENRDDDPKPAVAVFKQDGNHLTGTFLTPVGDYRYLEGAVNGNTLYLSCFDGGHMFLFKAVLQEDGSLKGDFWSRDSWHDTWTATRNETIDLEDPFAMTTLAEGSDSFRFQFPDLEGNMVDQDAFEGKVRLITIFGSWCPNCNDEAPFLQKLYDQYRDQGLEVIGLAFEMTGDMDRSVRVLERYKKRHGLDYTILVAGSSTDKVEAAAALMDLDRVIAFPTTLMIDRQGKVTAIHTGFTGPGTGELYTHLEERYHQKIKSLL